MQYRLYSTSNERPRTERVNNSQVLEKSRSNSPEHRVEVSTDSLKVETPLKKRKIIESEPIELFPDLWKEILSYRPSRKILSQSLRTVSQLFRNLIDSSGRIRLKELTINNLLSLSTALLNTDIENRLGIRLLLQGLQRLQTIINFINNPSHENILKRIDSFTFCVSDSNREKVLELLNLLNEKAKSLCKLTSFYFEFNCEKEQPLPAFSQRTLPKPFEIPPLPSSITSLHFDAMSRDHLENEESKAFPNCLKFKAFPCNLSSISFGYIMYNFLYMRPSVETPPFPQSLRSLSFPSYCNYPFQLSRPLPDTLEFFEIGKITDPDFQFPELPNNVKTLQLRDFELIKQYKLETLPENIKSLRILGIDNFENVSITSSKIPNTINDFYFGVIEIITVTFDLSQHTLSSFSINYINDCGTIEIKTFPSQLESFHIEYIGKSSTLVLPETIPESLKTFTFGTIEDPTLRQSLELIQAQVAKNHKSQID